MSISQVVIDGQQWALNNVATALDSATSYLDKMEAAARNAADQGLINNNGMDDAALKARLAELMTGHFIPIPESVWQSIWDRQREQSIATMNDSIGLVNRQLAAAGWEQPIGESNARIEKLTQSAAMDNSESARQTAITKANMTYDTIKFAIQAELERAKADAGLTIEMFKSNLFVAQSKLNYLMEAAKAGAQITAQELASFASSLSFNSSISSGQSASTSQGHNISHKGSDGDGPYLVISG